MEMLAMLRSLGALGMVLAMLAGALWAVRRYDIKLPGRVSATRRKRVELVERLSLDAKRSVALIRRDGREHLILMGPEGQATIETGIVAPERAEPETAPEPVADFQADLAAITSNFGKLIERPKAKLAEVKAGILALKPANDVSAEESTLDAEDFDGETFEDECFEDVLEAIDTTHTAEIIELPRAARTKRTRRPRDTARWNRRAVREALNG